MNIIMLTNTYLPHVGGVARSVASFTEALRERGHRVLVVAPRFEGEAPPDPDVVRLPAIQNFNGSDFSVRLAIPGYLHTTLDQFKPELVHSHHPFLLGDTALRIAARRNLPMVFTHHTMYEKYTHYMPANSPVMQQFAIRMATEYANLCDHVIAPSESIKTILAQRGVTVPITAIPTGIDPEKLANGNGANARQAQRIPDDAFVIGHVGRLAYEKNLPLLARAISDVLNTHENAQALLVGSGAAEQDIRSIFEDNAVLDRVHMTGKLQGSALADAYHAMDVFAFASQTETQGMVLAEAMTVGVPVVAVDAPGAREVVENGVNGRLLEREDQSAFAAALREMADMDTKHRQQYGNAARRTAEMFTLERCTDRLIGLYEQLTMKNAEARKQEENAWTRTLETLENEWNIWSGRAEAAADALRASLSEQPLSESK